MARVTKINALASEKMDFSTLGIRSELKDYELAYWLNLYFDLKLIKNRLKNYILNQLIKYMSNSCECGICGHHNESECLQKECKCCLNFHERSGPKRKSLFDN